MITSKQATQLVKEIANRMRDLDQVNQILLHPSNHNNDHFFPQQLNPQLGDYRLMEDYPGILLLFAELDSLFPHENWDAAVHNYVLKMKEIIESQGIFSLSLFGGLSGIAFVLQRASRGGSRYQKMIASLNAQILKLVDENYLSPLEKNFHAGQPSPMALYDLIRGIVGIDIYGLNQTQDPSFALFTEKIARHLVHLSKPLEVEGRSVPGWYLPFRFQILKEDQQKYPKGNFNLGLAHGIPGVLAFLSIAILRGVEVAGQREAIKDIACWIKGHRQEHQGNLFWGTHVTFEEEIVEPGHRRYSSTKKNGWCYGTTGIARSLFLAGKALKCEELKSFAVDSFCSIFIESQQEWKLPSPTFCHGIAGFLMTTWMMYQDTHSSFLKKQVAYLKDILLEHYHEDYPFGFKNLERCRKGGFMEISQLNLHEGVSGILLTLLSLEGLSTWWHAPFLIGEGK